jgi:hypothetical protein
MEEEFGHHNHLCLSIPICRLRAYLPFAGKFTRVGRIDLEEHAGKYKKLELP